jgi:hypothetical protein
LQQERGFESVFVTLVWNKKGVWRVFIFGTLIWNKKTV